MSYEPFLSVSDGKIHVKLHIGSNHSDLVTASVQKVAEFLFAYGVTEWMNSSTMDFGVESGWPRDDVHGEVVDALRLLYSQPEG